jgi:hypothetical protein
MTQFDTLSAEISGGLAGTFLLAGAVGEKTQPVRRDLIRLVIALDSVIDEAIGETSDLRYRLRGLQAAVEGLFTALSGWRMVANHLGRLPDDQRRPEADAVLRRIPSELRSVPVPNDTTRWTADPAHLRRVCAVAVRGLVVLPASATFAGLATAIGLVLIPAGALSTLPWQASVFGTIASWFVAFAAPENQLVCDTQQFYNSTLAIVAGASIATLAFHLLPPLSPAFRVRRLLGLTLRDLRRLAITPVLPARGSWESKVYGRLSVLPEQAEPLQRAQLLAALSVGTEIIRLRRNARRIPLGVVLDTALETVAHGQSLLSAERLGRVHDDLAIVPGAGQRASVTLRVQGSIRAISEALVQHASYFDSEPFR